jgi:putative oxidoreductase
MEKKNCNAKTIIAMVLGVLLGAFFVYKGYGKWSDMAGTIGFFNGMLHYPIWLAYTVATLELLGGILLLFPKTAFQGAILIIGVMIGALYTHFTAPIGPWYLAGGALAVALIIAVLRVE